MTDSVYRRTMRLREIFRGHPQLFVSLDCTIRTRDNVQPGEIFTLTAEQMKVLQDLYQERTHHKLFSD